MFRRPSQNSDTGEVSRESLPVQPQPLRIIADKLVKLADDVQKGNGFGRFGRTRTRMAISDLQVRIFSKQVEDAVQ